MRRIRTGVCSEDRTAFSEHLCRGEQRRMQKTLPVLTYVEKSQSRPESLVKECVSEALAGQLHFISL